MIPDNKERIMITLPKPCIKGLKTLAKKKHMKVSKLIYWMINKTAVIHLDRILTNDIWPELQEIAHGKWLD